MIDPLAPDFASTPAAPARPRLRYAPADLAAPPVVSVVTPFFNVGPLFHETAQALDAQTFQQWEWLIVNDGSTDPAALAVLARYRAADPRIRVLDLPRNGGPGAARNAGVQATQTAWVLFLDADDLLEPTALEKWLWCLISYPEYAFIKGYTVHFEAQPLLWTSGFHEPQRFLEANQVNTTSLIRRAVHQAVGGFDETIRGGFEDWDFWLRCASHGFWGGTVPEFLDWYRRRPAHADRWATWDGGERERAFREQLRQRYPQLWRGPWPNVTPEPQPPYADVPHDLPFANHLQRSEQPRLLLVVPWLRLGGADKFNRDLVQLLVEQHGYQVTIATTLNAPDQHWLPEFTKLTPDIFVLQHILRPTDYPRFLRYLIQSRQIDTVLLTNSYLGYQLLPYLRAYCPDVTFLDYIHMEEEYWKNGGYPRASLNYAEQLDLTVVSSQHLKQWMVVRGGDSQRIEVCPTNIDPDDWDPARYNRAALRQALTIPLDVPVLLYAGRICAQKQPKVFAEAVQELAQRGRTFVALVAGTGEDEHWLRDYAQRHGLHQIWMLGAVSNARMRELLALSDIFFLPSQHEGISLALYEAMAMGVVPVSAAVGGQAELVTPDVGTLVPRGPRETAAYVQALEQLLANPARRQQLAQAGRTRIVQHFRLEQMGQRMVALIGQARANARAQPHPTLPRSLANQTAVQAIESLRLENLAEQIWRANQALLASQPTTVQAVPRYVALRAIHQAKARLHPAYRWSLRHGLHWLRPLRERLRTRFGV